MLPELLNNSMKKYLKSNIEIFVALICIAQFLVIALFILNDGFKSFDENVYSIFSKHITEGNTIIARIVSDTMSTVVCIIITALCLYLIKNKRIGYLVTINLLLIHLENEIIKIIFARPRPIVNPLIHMDGWSFPSGHAMKGIAFYGLFIFLIYKYMNNIKGNILLICIPILIAAIGCSRVYLGVHYPSDVLAGWTLGLAHLMLFYHVFMKKKFDVKLFRKIYKK